MCLLILDQNKASVVVDSMIQLTYHTFAIISIIVIVIICIYYAASGAV